MVRSIGLVLLGVWLAVVTGAPLLHLADHALGHDHVHVGSAILWQDDDSPRPTRPRSTYPAEEAPGDPHDDGDLPADSERTHGHDAMLGATMLPAASHLVIADPSVAQLDVVQTFEGRAPVAYRNASAPARGPPPSLPIDVHFGTSTA